MEYAIDLIPWEVCTTRTAALTVRILRGILRVESPLVMVSDLY